jgi:uncharacterized protein
MKLPTRWLRSLLCLLFLAGSWSVSPAQSTNAPAAKIRVLLVTGGHEFEQEPFFKLFRDNPGISYRAVEHPKAHELLAADKASQFDVLVLYDMNQEISEAAKADFLARLNEGKGLVVLHHAIANYQAWPEYARVIGARYYLENTTLNGVDKARSVYQHDMHFPVHVADPNHPVTRGVADFEIHDETYNLFDVFPEAHPLLTTTEPKSNQVIAWVKTYGPARVVYLQSGHDHFAYENPNYRRLLAQAIRWTSGRN